MEFDLTINISDIIALLTIIVTIIVTRITIIRNKNDLLTQINEERQIHNENKNIELRKNQLECLPILDIDSLRYIGNGQSATFNFLLKNIGNGTALKCFFDVGDNLVIYSDPDDTGLQYTQASPGQFILNVNDSFDTSIITNRIPNKTMHKVSFSIIYKDLMGRTYKQPFVFFYDGSKIAPEIINKYEWICTKDIEFK